MLIVLYLVLAGLIVALAIGAWILVQLHGQRDEIADRLTMLEQPAPHSGRPPKSANERFAIQPPTLLNDFALPNLAGSITTLSQWRGRRILLIYVQSDCPHSRPLLKLIADRETNRGEPDSPRPTPVIVSTGQSDWLRTIVDDRVPLEQITLQSGTGVTKLHKVSVTPAAYLVDTASVTESPLICGVDAILTALETGTHDENASPASVDLVTTPLTLGRHEALIPLSSGSLLPMRDLPDEVRERIAQGSTRGMHQTLLIVDPECAACYDLLASIHDPRDEANTLILVGVGDAIAHRRLADDTGLSTAPLDDPKRTLALAAGTVVSPSALVLDEEGRLAAPIAVGLAATTVLLSRKDQPMPVSAQPRRTQRNSVETPLVSAIVTTRDRPGFLRFAIASFQKQTYSNRELIVVDDGDRYPVDPASITAAGGRLVRVPTGTPIGAKLNAGLEVAKGVLCQKMDDDDWYAPRYIETMVTRIQESWHDGCRPTVAFVSPFLFFDVARWEIRRSRDRNVPGATLFFRRADWALHPFRPLPGDEDLWFFLDQMEAHARSIAIDQPELFLAVRHRGSRQERGHTWVTQMDTRPLEDYLLERPLHSRTPEKMLPRWAVAFYRELRTELLAANEPDSHISPSQGG